MKRTVTLNGGSPWGFRLIGGSDFHASLAISKVSILIILFVSVTHCYLKMYLASAHVKSVKTWRCLRYTINCFNAVYVYVKLFKILCLKNQLPSRNLLVYFY